MKPPKNIGMILLTAAAAVACAALIFLSLFFIGDQPIATTYVQYKYQTYHDFFTAHLHLAVLIAAAIGLAFVWNLDKHIRVRISHLIHMPKQRAAIFLFFVSLCIIAIAASQAFRYVPFTGDEISFELQARTFAEGKLWLEPTPFAQFFRLESTATSSGDRIFGINSPGHALTLMWGYLLFHHTKISILVMASLTVVFTYLIWREIRGRSAALVPAAALLLSPLFLIMSSSKLSQVSSLFFITLFVFWYIRMFTHPTKSSFILAGLFLGLMGITRPVSAAGAALPFLLYLGYVSLRRFRERAWRTHMLWFGCTAVVVVLVLFMGYNFVMTGDLSFGAYQNVNQHFYWSEDHTALDALTNVNHILLHLEQWFLGAPGLLALTFALLLFHKKDKWNLLFLGGIISILFFYSGWTWWSSNIIAPHYAYGALVFLVLLFSDVLVSVYRRIAQQRALRIAFMIIIGILIAVNMTMFFIPYAEGYSALSDTSDTPFRMVREQHIDNSIIFFKSTPYVFAYYAIESLFHDDVLYAQYLQDYENQELLNAYPEKSCYYFEWVNKEPLLYPCNQSAAS